jgi:hypothetical protein
MNGGEFGGGLGYGPVIDLLMLKSGDAAVPSVVGTEQDRASPTRAATTTLAVLLAAAVGSTPTPRWEHDNEQCSCLFRYDGLNRRRRCASLGRVFSGRNYLANRPVFPRLGLDMAQPCPVWFRSRVHRSCSRLSNQTTAGTKSKWVIEWDGATAFFYLKKESKWMTSAGPNRTCSTLFDSLGCGRVCFRCRVGALEPSDGDK